MKSISIRIVTVFFLMFFVKVGIAENSQITAGSSQTRESLFEYITSEDSTQGQGQPLYRSWEMFPSNTDMTASNPTREDKTDASEDSIGEFKSTATALRDEQYKSEYFLKRLGLPVHGRWVSTYVNPVARTYLLKAITMPESAGRLEMPIGSIIVKENYLTEENFKASNNTGTSFAAKGGDAPRPAVLTVLLKVGADFCQSEYLFNGNDCFGGSWLWAFYGVNDESKHFDSKINSREFCMNCHAPAANSDYLRSLQSQRRSFITPQKALTNKAAQPASAKDVCEGDLSVSPLLPHDVPLDPLKVSNAQKMFDCVSWKSFVALNWPANPKQRGEPNTLIAKVTDPGFMQGPRVWQTYKETYEVFQPTIKDWDPSNQSWNDDQPNPAGQGCDADLPLISIAPRMSKTQSSVSVGNEKGQAFAGSFGTLKDQNNNLVRYEVRFNRDEFDYILNTKSAVTRNLYPSGPAKASLPDNKTGKFGGAIEIKAAWREMCTTEPKTKGDKQCFPKIDNPNDYFTQQVLVYYTESDDKPAHCKTKTMGLIALHIAHKTHWAPQWIWSTFSFKNNVPNAGDPHAQATAFYDPARAESGDDDCWSKPFLGSPENCPNVELNRFSRPPGLPIDKPWPGTDKPNQVTRLQPIAGSGLNETFNKLYEGTPFANYILLNTQWPLNGRTSEGEVNAHNCKQNTLGGNCFTMIPKYLRNPVVESYMTTYNYQREQYSNRSCMGCHTEGGADASYIWLDGVEQVVPID